MLRKFVLTITGLFVVGIALLTISATDDDAVTASNQSGNPVLDCNAEILWAATDSSIHDTHSYLQHFQSAGNPALRSSVLDAGDSEVSMTCRKKRYCKFKGTMP